MTRTTRTLARVYAGLLRFYPRSYRQEFAAERQEVFERVLQDSTSQGRLAVLRLVLREVRDLPISILWAILQERGLLMKSMHANQGEGRISWVGLLAGLWPFLFLGPIMALAPYFPGLTPHVFNYDTPLWMAILFLSILLGLWLGWRNGFPRWSYPYIVILFFTCTIPLLARLSLLVGPDRFDPLFATALLIGSFIVLVTLFLLILWWIPPLRQIYRNVRADWTCLSFGFYTYLAFATGFYGGDHRPPLSLMVILPALCVLLGAVIHLLSRARWVRALALLIPILLSAFLVTPSAGSLSLMALFLVTLIFLPALIGLIPGSESRLA